MPLAFESTDDLARALLRAGLAHGEYEEKLGQGRDADWAIWYAQYLESEQAAAGTSKDASTRLSFPSAADLAAGLLRAEQAHGQHQAETGREEPDWPRWYARYFEREMGGREGSA